MAARSEDAAANGRAVWARFPLREVAAIVAVVFTATGVLIAGMQWAVSNNTGSLFLLMRDIRSEVLNIRDDLDVLHSEVGVVHSDVGILRSDVAALRSDVGVLRGEVGELRTEVGKNRDQIADLRERVAKVEVGLGQVQVDQARILEIIEHERRPRG